MSTNTVITYKSHIKKRSSQGTTRSVGRGSGCELTGFGNQLAIGHVALSTQLGNFTPLADVLDSKSTQSGSDKKSTKFVARLSPDDVPVSSVGLTAEPSMATKSSSVPENLDADKGEKSEDSEIEDDV